MLHSSRRLSWLFVCSLLVGGTTSAFANPCVEETLGAPLAARISQAVSESLKFSVSEAEVARMPLATLLDLVPVDLAREILADRVIAEASLQFGRTLTPDEIQELRDGGTLYKLLSAELAQLDEKFRPIPSRRTNYRPADDYWTCNCSQKVGWMGGVTYTLITTRMSRSDVIERGMTKVACESLGKRHVSCEKFAY